MAKTKECVIRDQQVERFYVYNTPLVGQESSDWLTESEKKLSEGRKI